MAADGSMAEAQARIEHKVDLLLHLVASMYPNIKLPAVGDLNHICPLCKQSPKYLLDTQNAVVVRKCGCGTGKVPVDLKALEPPKLSRRNNDVGSEDSGSSVEDRTDTGSGRGHPGAGGKQGRGGQGRSG